MGYWGGRRWLYMEYIDVRRDGRCCSGRYLPGAGAGALAGRIAEMGGLVGYLIMLYYASRALRGLYTAIQV
jgi:hypothetical protein